MQITFNSYEEMVEFMEKMKEQTVTKAEPAAPVTGESKLETVPYGRQIASDFPNANVGTAPVQNVPVSAPVQSAQATSAPAAPTIPVQATVPTSQHEYTMDELARAAMTLMDKGDTAQLQQLLSSYGVETLPQLPKEQYGNFATALRGMGAQI